MENTEKATDIERNMLGAILCDLNNGERARELVEKLGSDTLIDKDSFVDDDCRKLYIGMIELAKKHDRFDVPMLKTHFDEIGVVLGGGTASYLGGLIDDTTINFDYYHRLMQTRTVQRRAREAIREWSAELMRANDLPSIDWAIGKLDTALIECLPDRLKSADFKDAVRTVSEQLTDLVENGRAAMTGLSTGYRYLDERLFGLKAGEMIVVAARPSVGKTTLGMNIARNVAKAGHPVLVFSAEMDTESLVRRMLAGEARVDQWRASRELLTGEERARMKAAIGEKRDELAALPIYIESQGIGDIAQIRSHARHLRRKEGIELIVVDYLQLLESREAARNGRQYETAAISKSLKAMARELKVPVIAISQLSRANEQRGDRDEKPKLSDLRDSGAIEQDADVVLLLRRPLMVKGESCPENERDLVYINIAKHRNGEIGEIPMRFNGAFNRFEDLSSEEYEAVKNGMTIMPDRTSDDDNAALIEDM